jgi:hypothetical protein
LTGQDKIRIFGGTHTHTEGERKAMEITGRDNELVELDSFLTEALVLAKEG